MKSAAFIFGMLASALAVAATPELGGLKQAFLEAWAAAGGAPGFGPLLWYVLAGAGVVGGSLSLLSPLSGGLLLIAATCGWIALGTAIPDALQVAAPLTLCLLGSFLAFLAAGTPSPLPLAATRRPPTLAELEREAALSLDLSFSDERPSVRSEKSMASAPAGRVEPRTSILAVANVVLLAGLTGAVGLLYYLEWRDASHPAATSFAELPSVTSPIDPVHTASTAAPAAMQAPLDVAPLPAAADTATGEWSDPFAYCAAVVTVDAPDRRYVGPRLPAVIADGLGVPAVSPVDRARWRCADGVVLACASFVRPICAATPTDEEMREFCLRHPGASGLLAPAGTWSCAGTRPEIGPEGTWLVDAHGYYPVAWVRIAAR